MTVFEYCKKCAATTLHRIYDAVMVCQLCHTHWPQTPAEEKEARIK